MIQKTLHQPQTERLHCRRTWCSKPAARTERQNV